MYLNKIVVLTFLLALAAVGAAAQGEVQTPPLCGVHSGALALRPRDGAGGIHITSGGLLRVLVVFASFPDDETPHPYWPAHGPPLFMSQFIDPDTTTNSQVPFNLTNYFRQMSMGRFHFVGQAIWVESGHSQEEYRNGSFGRANTNVLQESVDPQVDFSGYDSWTNEGVYNNINVPDGMVDMIVMVWRTTMWQFFGEASLGYTAGFTVDGKRIEMGFPERVLTPLGSGVTCVYPYADSPYQLMQTMVHEVGHWLLGGLHPYNGTTIFGKHAYWGILCNGGRIASCANAYDREQLGWITVPEIQPDQDMPLTDYVSTGVAYKYHPVNGEPLEYFYVENHQGVSVFDDVTSNPGDKGVWILHQQGPYVELDNLKIRPSDGNWNWENPASTTLCFGQQLPVFMRGVPRTRTGPSHRDQIPTQTSAVNWLLVYKDPSDGILCGNFPKGERFTGAFSVEDNSVFSPYSNPGSTTWDGQATLFSLEMVNNAGGRITARYNSNPLDNAPARRYLGHDPAFVDTLPGPLSLAWGAQWPEGQALEADVNWSELERQVGNGGPWSTVYAGPAMSWSDSINLYDTSGTASVIFRVRVRDTQNKYSSWSNALHASMMTADGVDNRQESVGGYRLESNYPNPFNPTTRIRFHVSDPCHVTLQVYDVLGKEVRTLVNGQLGPGSHERVFDAGNLAGGVYFYRLQAGEFVQTKKLLLLR